MSSTLIADESVFGGSGGENLQLSVVVPLHDAALHVHSMWRQIEGLQDSAFDIVLIDDGSKDNTWDSICVHARNSSRRVTTIRLRENVGVGAARNIAVKRARGEYVWFVDADDHWPCSAARDLLAPTRSNSPDIVFGQAMRVTDHSSRTVAVPAPHEIGPVAHDKMVELYLKGDIQGHLWNKLFKRSLFSNDVFPVSRSKSDAVGVIRLISRASFGYVSSALVYEYRLHSGSIATSNPSPLDLLRVLTEVCEKFPNVDPRLLRRFMLTGYSVPVLCEMWRAQNRDSASELSYHVARGLLSARGQFSDAVVDGRFRDAVFVAGMRIAPNWVQKTYRAARKREWLG